MGIKYWSLSQHLGNEKQGNDHIPDSTFRFPRPVIGNKSVVTSSNRLNEENHVKTYSAPAIAYPSPSLETSSPPNLYAMPDPEVLDAAVKPPAPTAAQIEAATATAGRSPAQMAELREEEKASLSKDTAYPSSETAASSSALTSHPTSKPTRTSSSTSAARNTPTPTPSVRDTPTPPPTDPTTLLPSSPPQIYLNLLILEASLRAQYLSLRSRRRQHVFFMSLLSLWLTSSIYAVFLRPREDGIGRGGSVYWVLDMWYKVALLGGAVTSILIWGTGVWERGVRWPRRWVGVTNRGLRVCNLKVVVLRGKWWERVVETAGVAFPVQALLGRGWAGGSEFRIVDLGERGKRIADEGRGTFVYRDGHKRGSAREEDISRGGDAIKLLLLPKHFSPEFRENWEMFRAEYWERENERRAELRRLVRRRQREERKARGRWASWTGYAAAETDGRSDLEKRSDVGGHHAHRPSKDPRRRERPSSMLLEGGKSHSRTSSRSSTAPMSELDEVRAVSRARKPKPLTPLAAGSAAPGTVSASGSMRASRSPFRRHDGDEGALHVHGPEEQGPPGPRSSSGSHAPPPLHKRASNLSNASESSNDSAFSERSTTSSAFGGGASHGVGAGGMGNGGPGMSLAGQASLRRLRQREMDGDTAGEA